MDNRPIGVFDSGIGGLTVVDALAKSLPEETIVYVGDTARVPYGNKSKNRIQQYAQEITAWLSKQDCKIIIVACNTASALALKYLESTFSMPIIGVIESGVNKGIQMSQNNKIAVLGTAATIRSNAYVEKINAVKPEAFVISQACPLFVPLAEEGWTEGKNSKSNSRSLPCRYKKRWNRYCDSWMYTLSIVKKNYKQISWRKC